MFMCKVISLVVLFEVVWLQKTSLHVTNNCLGCICEGISGCDTVGVSCYGDNCDIENITIPLPSHCSCGHFRLSIGYWKDGGEKVLNGDDKNNTHSFKRCSLDKDCSAESIQGYVSRYTQDCNEDGRIDCDDFALMHYYGAWGCKKHPLSTDNDFGKRYLECKKFVDV